MKWKKYSDEKPSKGEYAIIINQNNDICFGSEWEFCWGCDHELNDCKPIFWVLAIDIPRPNQQENLDLKKEDK